MTAIPRGSEPVAFTRTRPSAGALAIASTFGAVPVGAGEFEHLMAALGAFESTPRLAVAVSGGADSLALALLADGWARKRKGAAVALTVDHGLRRESATEAVRVGAWLQARGIAQVVLRWQGPKPVAGVQEAAREARYRLLEGWCREAGVLHLLLGHHLDDQAETMLLRRASGSGAFGLAAMAAVVETASVRRLRPLLAIPGARLVATLTALGQPWLEDPSNRNPAFARSAARAALAAAAPGTAGCLFARTEAAGRRRQALEEASARLLAQAASLHPAGFVRLSIEALAAADDEVATLALARTLTSVGGAVHAPRTRSLARLAAEVRDGLASARTLAGCIVAPEDGTVVVSREARHAPAPLAVVPGVRAHWDGRFTVVFAASGEAGLAWLGQLGRDGWVGLRGHHPEAVRMPPTAIPSLPAVRDRAGVVAVPHLGYRREGAPAGVPAIARIAFQPRRPLAPPAFALAQGAQVTIS